MKITAKSIAKQGLCRRHSPSSDYWQALPYLTLFYPAGPTVIKLFESENILKCKNGLHDLIETLCLFSNY